VEKKIQKINISKTVACIECDLLLKQVDIGFGHTLFCPRCGSKLYTPKKDSIDKTLSLSITALVLYLPAVLMPLMTIDVLGFEESGSIIEGVVRFYDKGYLFVALMVLLTSLLFPLAKLSLLFTVSLSLKLKRYPDSLPVLMRFCCHLDEWGMLEVYMIGILVTIVKVYHLAHIHYNFGFFCFTGLLLATLCSSAAMDEHLFWDLIEKKEMI